MASQKISEKKLQEKVYEIEMLRKETAGMEQQVVDIDAKLKEFEDILTGVKSLKGMKNNEVLLPIGAGALMRTKLKEDDKCLINVGANVLVEKTLSETQDFIKKQMERLIDYQNELAEDLQERTEKLRNLEQELSKSLS